MVGPFYNIGTMLGQDAPAIIADNLRRLIKENELNAATVAAIARSNEMRIGRLLRGRCMPKVDILIRVAGAFDVTVDYLLVDRRHSTLKNVTA